LIQIGRAIGEPLGIGRGQGGLAGVKLAKIGLDSRVKNSQQQGSGSIFSGRYGPSSLQRKLHPKFGGWLKV